MTRDRTDMGIGADLYCELTMSPPPTSARSIVGLLPGLLVAGSVTMAAAWLSDHYGMPIVLLGLLLGLSMSFVSTDERVRPGLDLLSQHGLRLGVILLGARITWQQFTDLGLYPFILVALIAGTVLGASLLAARVMKRDPAVALLAGGATAICGASAALALYSLLGEKKVTQSQLTAVILGITMASAAAMAMYPPLAGQIGLTDAQAGFFLGASIHDVAQAVGGGFAFSDMAGEYATIVKLARVSLLVPLLFIVGIYVRDRGEAQTRTRFQLPWFIGGFLVLVAVNSLGAVPSAVSSIAVTASQALLACAIVSTALKARLHLLMNSGGHSLYAVVLATAVSGMLSMLAALAI